MGRPSTELFAPSGSVHQQMQPEEAVQFPPQNPQMMPLHSMPQSNPQNLAGPGQSPQANQSFWAQPTLYAGQPIPVGSQIQAGFQPSHPAPDFITGPTNAPAPPFHTAGANYPQVPFPLHNLPPMPQGMIVQLTPAAPPSPWTTGLFDCMDDPLNAVVSCCFPCVTFGQIAEIVDRGSTSCGTSGLLYGGIQFLIGCPCLLSCTYRTKLRHQFNLIESPAPDWITHFFCECCALSQEYRELKNRGLDPSIGWPGNAATMQNVQYQVAMVPPMHQQPMTMRA
ncbi:protein PLANT CADMIUM RESISTANCE 6-like isoform X2 [Rhodamnia argentea]|uniref:Protein PLANT CADMIUM RESISTANCE 6-like isoform X2 n=1 Tax=Rhodamnia argentea TaxID=178133 RepID=A0A8B8PPX9_9MYRT|nr:protein PLANT CADMIUM RESISTANCE 6-like isoform X2 [Rhodamnia argentea]XP_048139904.1 protein PLANT CADMIUM RESISTANCE 6-like isoform X2 [Rhodamnia argentea]